MRSRCSRTPHVIPYQGSKRKLAADILSNVNFDVNTFYEPFAGSAAITIAAAMNNIASNYVISDKLKVLADLWTMIVENPEGLIQQYMCLWESQLSNPKDYYFQVREAFNKEPSPPVFLYLVARCVKNSVRFNKYGEFNQGADNRRLGMKPSKLAKEVRATSSLLKDKVIITHGDFGNVLQNATSNDFVYMDPPWQGTSQKTDPRYAYLLDLDKLIDELESLNSRNVPYLLSFDGSCGKRTYGVSLPDSLELRRIGLNAGRSSQATLLGRDDETIESLYLSPALLEKRKPKKREQKEILQGYLFTQTA